MGAARESGGGGAGGAPREGYTDDPRPGLATPRILRPEGEAFVAKTDAREAEKTAQSDPALVWLRNGFHVRAEPGADPLLAAPGPGIVLMK